MASLAAPLRAHAPSRALACGAPCRLALVAHPRRTQSRALENRHLPEDPAPIEDPATQTGGRHDRLDLRRSVDPEPDVLAEEAKGRVEDHGPGPDPPGVPGVDEAVSVFRQGGREPYERPNIRVAADHAVQGDDVDRLDVRGELDEVTDLVADAIRDADPLRFRPCSLDVGR